MSTCSCVSQNSENVPKIKKIKRKDLTEEERYEIYK